MTLHQMLIFQKIVEMRSFSSAGEDLLLSEPSISAQFKSFEKSLGLNLINRQQSCTANEIVLTEAGYVVYESVQRILKEYGRILEVSKIQGNKNADIKIVTNSPVGTYLLPRLLSNYNRFNPAIKIQLSVETNYYHLLNLAKNQAYDICLIPVFENVSFKNIVYSFKTQIVLVTSSDNLSTTQKLPLSSINDLSLLTPPLNSVVRKVLKTFFDKLSLPIKSSMELDHSESAKRVLLENPKFYALLSSITLKDELKSGKLRIIQTEPQLPYVEYAILKREERSRQSRVDNLLNYFIGNMDNLISENN